MKNHKLTAVTALAVLIAFAASAAAFAADKPKKDKDLILGTWTVAEGIYADDTVEKEMDMSFTIKASTMSFTIKASTMSNPMDGSEMPYVLDETAKTISSKGPASGMKIVYKVTGNDAIDFTEMTVTSVDAKTGAARNAQIVGPKGTFKVLRLARAK